MNGHGGEMTPETGSMATPGEDMTAGMNSAAYMLIHNGTSQTDRLLRVESNAAQAVELHRSEVVDEVMTMRPVESIEIPAGGEVRLEPGGLHVMLIGLTQPLEAGSSIPLTLVFENAGEITVDAEVRAP
jgi:copper(I)-binding protein